VYFCESEYAPGRDDAACTFCAMMLPGEPCIRCGLLAPLPVKRGL
jgi:hypothetical protein